jgi:hypothetical protein
LAFIDKDAFRVWVYLKSVSSDKYTGVFTTYWHFGRKPASMIAPDMPRHLLLKPASVMRVCMVTGLLVSLLPLKVIFKSAKLCAILAVESQESR